MKMTDAEQLEADQLEASSIRYAVGLRLAMLASGHWAIYFPGAQPEIVSVLDPAGLESLGLTERAQRAAWKYSYEQRRGEFEVEGTVSGEQLQATQTLEDMGL